MANRTDPDADTVHGANPQFLVDRIVRVKIYNEAWFGNDLLAEQLASHPCFLEGSYSSYKDRNTDFVIC